MKYIHEIEAVQLTYALATGVEPLENIPQWFIDAVESGDIKITVVKKEDEGNVLGTVYAVLNKNKLSSVLAVANSFIIKGSESYFTCMLEEDFKKYYKPKPDFDVPKMPNMQR